MNESRKIEEILDRLEPTEALAALTPGLKKTLAHLDEEARVGFVTDMIEEPGSDKVASMVNL